MRKLIFGALGLVFLLGCLGGCGGADTPVSGTAAGGLELSTALHELDALAAPPGVDAERFAELKAALHNMLLAHAPARSVSTAPDSDLSRVDDLSGTADETSALFHWSYRNQGDYDQNGIVGIPDLVPLAIHLNKTSAAPDWALAQVADGDNNGIVALPDLLPVAINLARRVVGYKLEYNTVDDPEGTWTQAAQVLFSTSAVPAGELRQFNFTRTDSQTGYYRVKPYDAETSGIPSEAVYVEFSALPAQSVWQMYGHDAKHTGRSGYIGPQTATLKWTFQSTGPGQVFGAAEVGTGGTVYAVAGVDVLAFSAAGELLWRKAGVQPWSLVVRPEGGVYVACADGKLLAYAPDGTQLWEQHLLGAGELSVGRDGTLCAIHGIIDKKLYVFSPDGGVKWKYPVPPDIIHAAVTSTGGIVYGTGSELFALTADGDPAWESYFGYGDAGPYLDSADTAYLRDSSVGGVTAISSSGAYLYGTAGLAMLTDISVSSDGWVYFGSYPYLCALSPAGKIAWVVNAPAQLNSKPAVTADGSIVSYCAGGALWAVEPDGAQRWLRTLGPGAGAWLCATPDGGIIVSGADNWLYNISPDGELRWKCGAGGGFNYSCVLGPDGTVFAPCTDGQLYAVNTDGSQRWRHGISQDRVLQPAVGADNAVYYADNESGLLALDQTDGSLIWTYGDATGQYCTAPIIGAGEEIYLDTRAALRMIGPDGAELMSRVHQGTAAAPPTIADDGTIYSLLTTGADDHQLNAYGPYGAVYWSLATGQPQAMEFFPALGLDGDITALDAASALCAISPTGARRWTSPAAGQATGSPAIGADGTIFIGYIDAYRYYIYAIDIYGALVWAYQTADAILAAPAIGADGTVYCCGNGGNIYALDTGGSLKWSYKTGGANISPPVIGHDGTLYVGSSDGRLYAFQD